MVKIEFLTRQDCVNTPPLQAHLAQALQALGWSRPYAVVAADTLPENDPRRRYGTPTILVNDRDLFGHPEPRSATSLS